MMKTVYHTLSCIENTVQLRNAGFIKWTKAWKIVFIAKVKYRKLQPPFVGNCRINGWGKCRF